MINKKTSIDKISLIFCAGPSWRLPCELIQDVLLKDELAYIIEPKIPGVDVTTTYCDFISDGSDNGFVTSANVEISKFNQLELIVPHTLISCQLIEAILSSCIDLSKLSIAFWPDGFTNRFIKPAEMKQFVSQYKIPISRYFTFSLSSSHVPSYIRRGSEHRYVDLSRIIEIFETKPYYKEQAKKLFLKFISRNFSLLSNSKLIIIAMRPWGSENFQRGRFSFSGELSLADYLSDLLKYIEPYNSTIILIPDSRDDSGIDRIVSRLGGQYPSCNVIAHEDWSPFLSNDVFFYLISNCSNANTIYYTFDSSLPIALQHLPDIDKIYFGCPAKLIDKYFDGMSCEFIKSRIASLVEMLDCTRPCHSRGFQAIDSTLYLLGCE